jgi:hypothetical protein
MALQSEFIILVTQILLISLHLLSNVKQFISNSLRIIFFVEKGAH